MTAQVWWDPALLHCTSIWTSGAHKEHLGRWFKFARPADGFSLSLFGALSKINNRTTSLLRTAAFQRTFTEGFPGENKKALDFLILAVRFILFTAEERYCKWKSAAAATQSFCRKQERFEFYLHCNKGFFFTSQPRPNALQSRGAGINLGQ